MVFKRLAAKEKSKHLRLRIESCVDTILNLNSKLGSGAIKPEVVKQFEKLRDSLQYVTDETVDEKDISRIEQATNQLLKELGSSWNDEQSTGLAPDRLH
ncbi:MAG: hypothetical protein AB9873_14015 [Syntrophobacteraceae bacterium]